MFRRSSTRTARFDQRLLTVIAAGLVLGVFLITWVSIRESRSDSYQLLVAQGTAFTEALAQASENTITSETFYDHLVQKRYSDLVASLLTRDLDDMSEQDLVSFALTHDLRSVYIFDGGAELVLGVVARGPGEALPDFAKEEVRQLLREPESNFVLLLEEDETPGEMVHYYLELTSRLDLVVVLTVDALDYGEALRQTGIGYLAQNMAREKGVEYIIYQSTEGIVFASRKPGDLLAIESDPFLGEVLESDTIMSRVFDFQGRNVLELVRPFSTTRYPFGLFRVGLSLEGYYAVNRGFDQQMLILSGTLVTLLLVALLYFRGRRKRRELSLQYTDMKSVTGRVFEQMRTGVVAVDSEGTIRLANQAFEDVFRVTNTVDRRWGEVMHGYSDLLNEFLGQAERSNEIELTLNSGVSERKLLVARSKFYDEDDVKPAVVMVVYDITRLRAFEQESQRKERLSEMGNLAAAVAHEIRNPLNTISIASQRLAAEFSPRENSEQYFAFTEQIRTETSRLNEIITRFLALAREDKRKRRKVKLDGVLREVADLLKVEGDRLRLAVTLETEEGLAAEADPDRLKQVFLNLFSNTKEALGGNPGGFSVRARRDGGQIVITVTDTGPGVPKDCRHKLFAPYYTTKEAGTGLGLPTVQKVISDMGGKIQLDEDYTGGTRFIICIPSG